MQRMQLPLVEALGQATIGPAATTVVATGHVSVVTARVLLVVTTGRAVTIAVMTVAATKWGQHRMPTAPHV